MNNASAANTMGGGHGASKFTAGQMSGLGGVIGAPPVNSQFMLKR